jgi:hypothetical protein
MIYATALIVDWRDLQEGDLVLRPGGIKKVVKILKSGYPNGFAIDFDESSTDICYTTFDSSPDYARLPRPGELITK